MSFDLSNYVDVKTRIKLFYERYPDGSLQFEFKGASADGSTIWGVAYAYRTPEDPRPSTGTASELAKGKTAFTAGSELMNLETSAIGRAIGNLGIGIEAGMATSDEVQFAKERQREIPQQFEEEYTTPPVTRSPAGGFTKAMMTEKQQKLILKLVGSHVHKIEDYKKEKGIVGGFTSAEASKFIEYLKEHPSYDPWAADIAKGGFDE